MKKFILSACLLLLATGQVVYADGREFPKLNGPYLGQRPPGIIPEIFAPGIVNTGMYTRDIAISGDGSEIYFCISDALVTGIFMTNYLNNKWSEPVIAPFSGIGFLDMEPCISSDGKRVFFLSTRPPEGQAPQKGWFYQNIWMTEKTEAGWTEPRAIDFPINTEENEFFPSLSNENTLYFTRSSKTSIPRIYKSALINNIYQDPEQLHFDVPDSAALFNAFIAPDESFIIVCANNVDSTNKDQDYYVSFKTTSGEWSKLIKFGPEVNIPGENANSMILSPDKKYLFFSSAKRDATNFLVKPGTTTLGSVFTAKLRSGNASSKIYWVSSKILDKLRP